MNMRIRDEDEYCIGITREENHCCARVSDWTDITGPYVAYRLISFKTSTAVTANQSPGYPAFLNSHRTRNNFFSDNANTLAEMFTAGKNIQARPALKYWNLQNNATTCGY
jgi:hypothetical protein